MAHIHLIGIGGTGLSAIAQVLLEKGDHVSGSDRQDSPALHRLRKAGATIFIGHKAENVRGADLILRSSAIPDDNVEVQAALALNLPVDKRADFMKEVIGDKLCVAIAGSHGKTTTTAMVAWILHKLGRDPSFIIGGISANLETSAHAGMGEHFVIEADEYDRMFLGLSPGVAVVTNVEHDHPDCYPTEAAYFDAFREFTRKITPGGILLACNDDRGARRLAREAQENGIDTRPYSLNHWAGGPARVYFGRDLAVNADGGYSFVFTVHEAHEEQQSQQVRLQVPGKHNVQNAVAALAVSDVLGLPLEVAASALGEFRGSGRRFDVRGISQGISVIDDYAHHPTEIRATLSAASARYPHQDLWVVWQPHTYSRTRMLLNDFATAFSKADHLLVTPVYAAREAPPEDGFSARLVVEKIVHSDSRFVDSFSQAVHILQAEMQPGDVLLVLSAGDADQISSLLLDALGNDDKRSSQEARNE